MEKIDDPLQNNLGTLSQNIGLNEILHVEVFEGRGFRNFDRFLVIHAEIVPFGITREIY